MVITEEDVRLEHRLDAASSFSSRFGEVDSSLFETEGGEGFEGSEAEDRGGTNRNNEGTTAASSPSSTGSKHGIENQDSHQSDQNQRRRFIHTSSYDISDGHSTPTPIDENLLPLLVRVPSTSLQALYTIENAMEQTNAHLDLILLRVISPAKNNNSNSTYISAFRQRTKVRVDK